MSAGKFMKRGVCVCVCVLYNVREYRFGFFKSMKTKISQSVFRVSLICSTVDSEGDFVIAVFFPSGFYAWNVREKEKEKK